MLQWSDGKCKWTWCSFKHQSLLLFLWCINYRNPLSHSIELPPTLFSYIKWVLWEISGFCYNNFYASILSYNFPPKTVALTQFSLHGPVFKPVDYISLHKLNQDSSYLMRKQCRVALIAKCGALGTYRSNQQSHNTTNCGLVTAAARSQQCWWAQDNTVLLLYQKKAIAGMYHLLLWIFQGLVCAVMLKRNYEVVEMRIFPFKKKNHRSF